MTARAMCVLGLLAASAVGAAPSALALETRVPGARINLDDGFVFDMNASGDYVAAWAPTDGSNVTKVLRGSAITGPGRIWSVESGFESGPDVAIADNGTMALGWLDQPKGPSSGYRIKKGAVWNPSDAKLVPHVLNRVRNEPWEDVGQVDTAINSSGTAAFTWVSGMRTNRIWFATGRADGSFSASKAITKRRRSRFFDNPKVSLFDSGDATVRWADVGIDCQESWFAPKHCRNRPSSLLASTATPSLKFSPARKFGKGCRWGTSDATPVGQIFALADCRSGFKYTAASAGSAFAPLQALEVLRGDRLTSRPKVKILKDGRVVVVYESVRYADGILGYSQIGGSTGMFGSALSAPIALTPEIDIRDAENQGGYYGLETVILEGLGSPPYLAAIGETGNFVAAIDDSGGLGVEIGLAAFVPPYESGNLGIAPDGMGFTIFSREGRSGASSLWTSRFALP